MEKIIIKNFGPINRAELDTDTNLVIIGPQASGKSTICKAIYFFKSFRGYLIKYLIDAVEKNQFPDRLTKDFQRELKEKFQDYWGTTFHMDSFDLTYYYDINEDHSVTINLARGTKYLEIEFSKKFYNKLSQIIRQAKQFSSEYFAQKKKFITAEDLLESERKRTLFYTTINQTVGQLFPDNRPHLYIPAARGLLSILSGTMKSVDIKDTDDITKQFINLVSYNKENITSSLDDLIAEYKNLERITDDSSAYYLASMIKSIIKASYRYEDGQERLYLENGKHIKINYASSGQQEVLWILLLTFLRHLEQDELFWVIEEPEAHLFPEAQKNLVEYLSFISNYKENQLVLTTHSPYILSSLNNLLYAWKVGQKKPKKVKDIIRKTIWQDPKQLQVYYMDPSSRSLVNILDEETGLIQSEYIDGVSDVINNEFETLLDLDND